MTSLSPPPKPKPQDSSGCPLTIAAFVAFVAAVVLGLRSLL